MEQKFLKCETCSNLVGMIHDAGIPIFCCGKPMEAMVANASDGAQEKHVPVVSVNGNKVKVVVGSKAHPMETAHSIEWIYLKTSIGGQRKALVVDGKPEIEFLMTDGETPEEAFVFCNLHGLWAAKV